MNNPKTLFSLSFIAICTVYYSVLGPNKSLEILIDNQWFILILLSLIAVLIFYKFKLKGYTLITFIQNNQLSLKSTVLIFLLFEVYDYYSEGGFIGIISLWFMYWIMGLIALVLMEVINHHKNYQFIRQKNQNQH